MKHIVKMNLMILASNFCLWSSYCLNAGPTEVKMNHIIKAENSFDEKQLYNNPSPSNKQGSLNTDSSLIKDYNIRNNTNFSNMEEITNDMQQKKQNYTNNLKNCTSGTYEYAISSPYLYAFLYEKSTIIGLKNNECVVETRISTKDATYSSNPPAQHSDFLIKCQYKPETMTRLTSQYIDFIGFGFSKETPEFKKIFESECRVYKDGAPF